MGGGAQGGAARGRVGGLQRRGSETAMEATTAASDVVVEVGMEEEVATLLEAETRAAAVSCMATWTRVASAAANTRKAQRNAAHRHTLLFLTTATAASDALLAPAEVAGGDNMERVESEGGAEVEATLSAADVAMARIDEAHSTRHVQDIDQVGDSEDGVGVARRAQELTSHIATLTELLEVASSARIAAQTRTRDLEDKLKEAVAGHRAADAQHGGAEERIRVLQEAAAASSAEAKALKKQLVALESKWSERCALAAAASEKKVLAALHDQEAEKTALQKTIRDLQRSIDNKKALSSQVQQRLHESEARASAAESKFDSVSNKIKSLEATEAAGGNSRM